MKKIVLFGFSTFSEEGNLFVKKRGNFFLRREGLSQQSNVSKKFFEAKGSGINKIQILEKEGNGQVNAHLGILKRCANR